MGLCSNIIELRDKYFQKVYEPITGKKPNKEFQVQGGHYLKEYLYIVTDFLPYTINDLCV
jgi:hypothetical protein